MTRRLLIPVLLTFCFFTEAFAQVPVPVQLETPIGATSGFSSGVCPAGVSAFAGTSTQALAPAAQSNDIEFLCINDVLDITHQGGQTFGDPDPSSPPGISYHFFDCPPTESGPDFATMFTDPCLLVDGGSGAPYIVQDPFVDINGNATFTNNGGLQILLNAGAPVELFFAPVTIDDWANFIYEADPMGNNGPCINLNVSDAFRVVYLNEIQATNINNAAQGNCTASFTAEGGLPEFDNSDYTSITIELASDPTITGQTTTNAPFSHGETVTFSVPQGGVYNVTLEDGKSCAATFQVDMSACVPLETTAGMEVTPPGTVICVPITGLDFTNILSFQYIVEYDPAVLTFNNINLVSLPDAIQSGNSTPGIITISWLDETFLGQTVNSTDVLYEICFTAIGALGTSSDLVFTGDATTTIEVTDPNGFAVGAVFNNGSVTIATSSFTLDFGVCTSLAGQLDGSFTVSTTGGTPPYNVGWVLQGNPGVNGTTTIPDGVVNGLNPGTYDVVVTDAAGDIVTGSVVIPNLDPLSVQTTFVNPSCMNGMDGSVSVNINNGVAPYDVLWDVPGGAPGSTTINNLGAGSYTVTVTDDLGCALSSQQSLLTPMLSLNLITEQDITCANGPNTGALTVEAMGDNPPFTYSWSNMATGPSVMNLSAGSYTVTAEDDNGCTIISTFMIDEPVLPVILSWDSISVDCPNQMTGALTVNVTPGSAPISNYQWDDPNNQTTQTATMLSSGTYSVTVTDDQGCSVVGTESLFSPSPLNIVQTVTEPSCPSFNNGTIQLAITGGTMPFQIQWENGSAFPVLPQLTCDSFYAVTVSDANNCETIELSIEVPCPPAIDVTIDLANVQGVSCNNGVPCDGLATALASGGTAGTGVYTFSWSSGETFSNVSQSAAIQLCQGEQFVIASDGLCPSDTAFVTIIAPDPLIPDLAGTGGIDASCFGESDGSYTVAATGGTPGYTYQWVNPSVTGPTISNVPAGTYIVSITDANGCAIPSLSIEVMEPDPFMALIDDAQTTDTVTCAGGADGQISVFSQGGNTGLNTYQWSPNTNDNASTATGLAAGTYSVTVTDPNGCSDETQISIGEPDPIIAEIPAPVEPLCNGDQTVVTIDTAYGGASISHTFSVDFGPPQFITSSIPILAGPHTIQVFDSEGCFTEYTIDVGEPAPVIVDLGDDITLELGDSVQLKPIIIVQDIPIDTILWDPLDDLTCVETANDTICKRPWVSPLETTIYELTVIDTNGCVGVDEIIVDIDRNRNVFIPNAFSPDGNGVNDVFKIYTGVGVAEVNYFRIYDRWGEQLYEDTNFLPGDNYLEGWDGRLNGKEMNSGVFIFIAEVVFVDGRVLLYRGDFSLVR